MKTSTVGETPARLEPSGFNIGNPLKVPQKGGDLTPGKSPAHQKTLTFGPFFQRIRGMRTKSLAMRTPQGIRKIRLRGDTSCVCIKAALSKLCLKPQRTIALGGPPPDQCLLKTLITLKTLLLKIVKQRLTHVLWVAFTPQSLEQLRASVLPARQRTKACGLGAGP